MAEWLDETYGLAATRAGEYMRETGSLPSRELMDMYQAEKRRRLEAYERDPEGFLLRPIKRAGANAAGVCDAGHREQT